MKPDRARERLQSDLVALGVNPQRWKGQNFLLDTTVVESAVAAAKLKSDEPVLEVGPGLGVLTRSLLATGATVTAIELEARFAKSLQTRFRNETNLTVISANLFRVDLSKHFSDFGYAVVSNLPYSLTGLALRNFFTVPPRPNRLVLLLQKEVAERLEAKPKNGSVLGVLAQAVSTVTILRIVPPEAFEPKPKVTSALVAITLHPEPVDTRLGIELETLLRVARMGFSARRKTLANNLASGLAIPKPEADKILAEIGIDPKLRAQDLAVDAWVALAKKTNQKIIDRKGKK